MEIHTFKAGTLQEALRQVRVALGPQASVLHTREVKNKRRLGFSTETYVEVEASVDVEIGTRLHSASTIPDALETFSKAPHSAVKEGLEGAYGGARGANGAQMLEQRAREFRSLSRVSIAEQLVQLGHSLESVRAILKVCKATNESAVDSERALESLQKQLAKHFQVGSPIELSFDQPTVVAFVGSAGVGKTVALSKLASQFYEQTACKIGMLTIDVEGAIDQLIQVADRTGAHLEVVSSARRIPDAIARLGGCDLILVDTPGRSPSQSAQIQSVRDCLRQVEPTQTLLVLSASNSSHALRAVLDAYGVLQPTQLMITKMEEAAGLALWLPDLKKSSLPISYLTQGQSLSGEIVAASGLRLAKAMLENP